MSDFLTAPALLAELSRRGVILQSDGKILELDAPRGALADLLPEIARFKPALLELLTPAPQTPDAARFWDEVTAAIEGARRGQHLAYTPALSWAWKAANRATERNLNSAQLCEVAQENQHE